MAKLTHIEDLELYVNLELVESVHLGEQKVGSMDNLPVTMEQAIIRMASGAEYKV